MQDERAAADRRRARRRGWYSLGVFIAVVVTLEFVLDGVGWSRLEINLLLAGSAVLFGVLRFGIAWTRADEVGRRRWRYRGHHDGSGSLGASRETWHGLRRNDS